MALIAPKLVFLKLRASAVRATTVQLRHFRPFLATKLFVLTKWQVDASSAQSLVSKQLAQLDTTVQRELIALLPVQSELTTLTQANSRLPTASSARLESSAIREAL